MPTMVGVVKSEADFSFSVEAFGDQSVRKYLSSAHFDVTVDKLYFCRVGIYVNVNLLSKSDLCCTKIHNSLVLKMNMFAHVYCRSNKTVCGPLVLQGSVWEILQQLLYR